MTLAPKDDVIEFLSHKLEVERFEKLKGKLSKLLKYNKIV